MRFRKWEWLLSVYMLIILPMAVFLILESINAGTQESDEIFTQPAIATDASVPGDPGTDIRTVLVIANDGQSMELDMDTYLVSVLLCEIPASFSEEALKAQAVVARTYTLRQQERGSKHVSAAVCTDPGCCQGYKEPEAYLAEGGSEAFVIRVRDAVSATEDTVLTYGGDLIEATYFSCSGGKTEDAVAVWGSDIPYLKSTESPGEEISDNYVRTELFSADRFRQLLSLDDSASLTPGNVVYTAGNGVATVEIGGKVFKGTELRKLLNLRSTAFVLSVVGDSVVVTTKGYGHRVGMSQYGAEAMARGGASFEEILTHYYQGAELAHYAALTD